MKEGHGILSVGLADEICERIANGESLRSICADDYMPSTTSVCRWLDLYPDFREQYTRARARQADYYADQIVTIADTAEDHNKARLQIDARKWVAAKLLPKKYGERTTTTHEGGEKPIAVTDATPLDIARRIAFALANAERPKD
jgi:hypothetical protein